jgi:hypothetical protein
MRKIGMIVVALATMAGIGWGELDRALRRVDSMRCGNALVSVGDDTSEVLAKCGEPAYGKRPGTVGKRRTSSRGDEMTSLSPEAQRKKNKKLSRKGQHHEVWSYNFGPDEFTYTLRFEEGTLKSIEVGGWGK